MRENNQETNAKYTFLLSVVTLLATGAVNATEDVAVAAFSHSDPPELQFGCAVRFSSAEAAEEAYVKTLVDGRLAATRALWRGHSRRHASKVLDYLADPSSEDQEYLKFKREVEASLRPEAIIHELCEGDYQWGAWLAFLRPNQDLVPELLTGLDKKDFLPETMLALGNSRDMRALQPLLERLESEDYRTAGDAAKALGYLGFPEVEPKLIAALAPDNGWRQVNACSALAKLGTALALPATGETGQRCQLLRRVECQGHGQVCS